VISVHDTNAIPHAIEPLPGFNLWFGNFRVASRSPSRTRSQENPYFQPKYILIEKPDSAYGYTQPDSSQCKQ
jgi:hypothetical protein